MNKTLRIIFMGTPEFAVGSLKILVENGYNIVGVITAPDKPAGRGKKIQQSDVKKYAVSQDLNILQPTNLKDPGFLAELKSLDANLQVVVAFRMLPEAVWSMPEYGTFNLHASLLPNYRGAAPINWAIINGEKETGVTTFLLKHEIDTGNILLQEKEPIDESDNVGRLYTRLMEKGAKLVLRTVQLIEEGKEDPKPQQLTGNEKPAPKIFKETCEINWEQPAEAVYNFIRGLSPYPAARTRIDGKIFKIFDTKITKTSDLLPGAFDTDNKSYIHIGTETDDISLMEVQMEGKKRMPVEDFLRGFNFSKLKN